MKTTGIGPSEEGGMPKSLGESRVETVGSQIINHSPGISAAEYDECRRALSLILRSGLTGYPYLRYCLYRTIFLCI